MTRQRDAQMLIDPKPTIRPIDRVVFVMWTTILVVCGVLLGLLGTPRKAHGQDTGRPVRVVSIDPTVRPRLAFLWDSLIAKPKAGFGGVSACIYGRRLSDSTVAFDSIGIAPEVPDANDSTTKVRDCRRPTLGVVLFVDKDSLPAQSAVVILSTFLRSRPDILFASVVGGVVIAADENGLPKFNFAEITVVNTPVTQPVHIGPRT